MSPDPSRDQERFYCLAIAEVYAWSSHRKRRELEALLALRPATPQALSQELVHDLRDLAILATRQVADGVDARIFQQEGNPLHASRFMGGAYGWQSNSRAFKLATGRIAPLDARF